MLATLGTKTRKLPHATLSVSLLRCLYDTLQIFSILSLYFGCLAGNKTLKIIATVAVRSFMVSSSFNPLNKVLAVRSYVVLIVVSVYHVCLLLSAISLVLEKVSKWFTISRVFVEFSRKYKLKLYHTWHVCVCCVCNLLNILVSMLFLPHSYHIFFNLFAINTYVTDAISIEMIKHTLPALLCSAAHSRTHSRPAVRELMAILVISVCPTHQDMMV